MAPAVGECKAERRGEVKRREAARSRPVRGGCVLWATRSPSEWGCGIAPPLLRAFPRHVYAAQITPIATSPLIPPYATAVALSRHPALTPSALLPPNASTPPTIPFSHSPPTISEMGASDESTSPATVHVRLQCGASAPSLSAAHGVQLSVPTTLGRKGLRKLVLHLLNLSEPDAPDLHFLAYEEPLRTTIGNFLTRRSLSTEATLPLTYYLPLPAPREHHSQQASREWLAAVDAALPPGESSPLVVVGSYSGCPAVFRGDEAVVAERDVTEVAHAAAVKGVAWLPQCAGFVSVSSDQTVRLWALEGGEAQPTGAFRSEEAGPPVAFEAVAVRAGDRPALAVGGADGSVWVVADVMRQVDGGVQAAVGGKRKAMDGAVLSASKLGITAADLAVSSVRWDAEDVVTAGWDGLVRRWDVDACSTKVAIPSGGKPVTSVSVGESVMLVSAVDGAVRLVDAREGKGVVAACGRKGAHRGVAMDACWIAAGKSAASAGADGTVRLWDVRALMTPVHVVEGAHGGEKCLAVSTVEDEVFSVGGDGKVARFRM